MVANVITLHEDVTLPVCSTAGSVGYDVLAYLKPGTIVNYQSPRNNPYTKTVTDNQSLYIEAGERVLIPTGLTLDISSDLWVGIYPRSGLSFKSGVGLSNSVGVIDSDYKQEVFVSIVNNSGVGITIKHGEKIAQMVLHNTLKFDNLIIKDDVRNGGFGSTDVAVEIEREVAKVIVGDSIILGKVFTENDTYKIENAYVNGERYDTPYIVKHDDVSDVKRPTKAELKRYNEALA